MLRLPLIWFVSNFVHFLITVILILQEQAKASVSVSDRKKIGSKTSQIILTLEETIEEDDEKVHTADNIQQDLRTEEFKAMYDIDEEPYCEVSSPKTNEQTERIIPIIVDDPEYLIPSQFSRNTEEAEVRPFKHYKGFIKFSFNTSNVKIFLKTKFF